MCLTLSGKPHEATAPLSEAIGLTPAVEHVTCYSNHLIIAGNSDFFAVIYLPVQLDDPPALSQEQN